MTVCECLAPVVKRTALITVERVTETVSATTREVVQTWATLGQAWAEAHALAFERFESGGREEERLDQAWADAEFSFLIECTATLATVNPKDRIAWKSEYYDILTTAPDDMGRPMTIKILARKRID